jgi:hypothetical protein
MRRAIIGSAIALMASEPAVAFLYALAKIGRRGGRQRGPRVKGWRKSCRRMRVERRQGASVDGWRELNG